MLRKRNSYITFHCVLLPCTLFSARSAVLGCYLTEQLFLENDGVFHLMDLLQVTSAIKRTHPNLYHLFYWLPKHLRQSKSDMSKLLYGPVVSLTSWKPSINLGFAIFLLASETSQRIKESHVQIALQAREFCAVVAFRINFDFGLGMGNHCV